jgi:hypothetical protein
MHFQVRWKIRKMLLAAKLIGLLYLTILYWIKPIRIVKIIGGIMKRYLARCPEVVKADYPVLAIVERLSNEIKDEILRALIEGVKDSAAAARYVKYDYGTSNHVDSWTIPLKEFGNVVAANARLYPLIGYLIVRLPYIVNADIKLIIPGGRVPVSKELVNGVMTYHLPLCTQRVIREHMPSECGGVLMNSMPRYDIRNRSGSMQLVLSVDLQRNKGLPRWVQIMNKGMVFFIGHSRRMQKAIQHEYARLKRTLSSGEMPITN